MRPGSTRALVVSVMCLGLALAACGGDDTTAPRTGRTDAVRVASFEFSESRVLGELYAGALERAGIPVAARTARAPREEIEPALEQGKVDVVPEYTGTALTFLDKGGERATADAAATHALLQTAFAARGITTLAASPAANQNAVAVTRATADRLHLARVSDLSPLAPTLTFGGPPECPTRRFCLPGFERVYGLKFKSFRSLDAGGPLTVGALQGGEVDVALLFTTTAQVDSAGFVLLEDDRGLQPADNVVPVVRTKVVERYGNRLTNALDHVSSNLTSEELRRLNQQVDVDGRPARAVARSWLASHPAAP